MKCDAHEAGLPPCPEQAVFTVCLVSEDPRRAYCEKHTVAYVAMRLEEAEEARRTSSSPRPAAATAAAPSASSS